jgi:hypothetical protein
LSNPGGVIPIKAVRKPESKDIIKFIVTLSAFTKENPLLLKKIIIL